MFLTPRHLLLASFAVVLLSAVIVSGRHPKQQQQQDQNVVSIQPSGGSRARGAAVTVTVDKSRVRVGEIATFTLTPATLVTNPRFKVTVDFGDGTRAETRRTEISHRYRAAGHYNVYASVVSPELEFEDPDRPNPQRPVPRVTLLASPASILAGAAVSFEAQLASSYPGIKYRFAFGDGSQTAWQEGSATSHTYETAGNYLAYVDLGLGTASAIRQVGGSLRQSILVTQANRPIGPNGPNGPDAPINPSEPKPGPVRLSANPTPVQTAKPVTFVARATPTNPRVRFRFVFGDGAATGWQESAQTSHTYWKPGSYSSAVDLGLETNGVVKRLSNARQAIRVADAPPVAIDFSANPTPVKKGLPVSFSAVVKSDESNLRYRFVFGDDSSPTSWQTDPKASYSYSTPGDYQAHVEIGRWTNGRVAPIATSSTKTISVTSDAIASASPSPGTKASPGPTDSTSVVSVNPASSPGNSGETEVNRTSGSWWPYLLIALLLLFVAYQMYSALVPRTTFHPSSDMGSASIDAGTQGLEIQRQVLLRPNVATAQYQVYSDEPSIVRSVRRENV